MRIHVKQIKAHKGGEIDCPSCNNHNALLSYSDYDKKEFNFPKQNFVSSVPLETLQCRDCGVIVENVEIL
jgi:C4-type Zn-finger protein